MSKTKHSFLKEIRNFHLKTLKNSFQFFSIKEVKLLFENSEIIEIKKSSRALFRAFQAHSKVILRKFFGIIKAKEKEFFIFSRVTGQPLTNFLNFLNFNQKLEIFRKLFYLLEKILEKNSEIVSFDLDCLVLDEFFHLKLDLKPQEAISEWFKAPEVIQGRTARVSLIYSFGKVAEVLFGLRTEDKNELRVVFNVQEIIKRCTERLVPRRLSLEALKLMIQKFFSLIKPLHVKN